MGFFQARILKCVAISFSRESSRPRDRTQVSSIIGRHLTVWATRKGLFTKCPLCSSVVTRIYISISNLTSPMAQWGKESTCNAGDTGDIHLIPGLGRSPGGEHGNPIQSSCLENPMDRRAWQATVHGVTKSRTWLSTHTHTHIYIWKALPSLLIYPHPSIQHVLHLLASW